MDLDDLVKLLIPFVWFVLITLGRVMKRRRSARESWGAQTASGEAGAAPEVPGEKDEEHERFYDEAERAEPAASEIRLQLEHVFRNLGLEVPSEEHPVSAAAPSIAPASELVERGRAEQEWVPEEEVPVEMAVDEEHGEFEVTHESLELERLSRLRHQKMARAARIRAAESPHLDAQDVRSAAVVRDALVLDAILHRPQWGRRPLRRSSSR